MIFQLELDVSDKKESFARDFFNSISFVKNVKVLKEKEITNPIPVAGRKKESLYANIKKGFVDKKSIDEGTLKTFPIESLFNG